MAMLYKPKTLLCLYYCQKITRKVKEHLTSMQQVDRRHYQQHPELPASNLDNSIILLQGNPTHGRQNYLKPHRWRARPETFRDWTNIKRQHFCWLLVFLYWTFLYLKFWMTRKETEAESSKELASQLADRELWHLRHCAHLKHWAWVDAV